MKKLNNAPESHIPKKPQGPFLLKADSPVGGCQKELEEKDELEYMDSARIRD